MRIHSLTMTAVGPYPGTEHVDFDRFTASGRFLLTGPTGSGKTTIIDAIVFALYGQVADGEDSSKDRIRSTHAEPTTRTAVELVFTTSAGTYRLRRTPEYQRPKKRGTGTTRESATAHLWCLADPQAEPTQEPVTGPRDVGAEVERVVGLSREQLTQTVVLPQGKFARFLRATSAERHLLLRDVFGTRIYDRIQKELAERSLAARRRAQQARAELDAAVKALAALLPPEPPAQAEPQPPASPEHQTQPERQAQPEQTADTAQAQEVPAQPASTSLQERLEATTAQSLPDPEALEEVLGIVAGQSQEAVGALSAQAEAAQAARDQASAALDAERRLAERIGRREKLLQEQSLLAERQQADQQEATRLKHADAAERVKAPAQAQARAQQAARTTLDQAHAQANALAENLDEGLAGSLDGPAPSSTVTKALADLTPVVEAAARADTAPAPGTSTASGPDGDSATEAETGTTHDAGHQARTSTTTAISALSAKARDLRHQAGGLTPLAELEAELPGRGKALEAQRQAHAEQAGALAQQQAELDARPSQYQQLQARHQEATQAQAELPALAVARDQARTHHQAAQEAAALTTQAEQARQTVAEAKAQASQAQEQVNALRQAWISATAGSLAAELQPEAPCPVCGSTTHPHPAQPAPGAVSRASLESAEAKAAQERTALEQAAQAHHRLTEQQAAAHQRAQGQDAAQAQAALAAAEQALASRTQQAAPLEELKAQVEGFGQQTQALAQALATATASHQAQGAQLDQQEQSLAADTRKVTQARDGASSVTARVQALQASAEHIEATAQALRETLNRVEALTQARTALEAALHEAGFATPAQAQAAQLGTTALAALREQVDAARLERQRVALALAEDEIATLTGTEQADLPAAQAAQQRADTNHTQAVRELERALAAHKTLTTACQAVRQAATTLTATIQDQAALLRVAELASGSNDAATPLATWVLLERFKEVLVFANQRLAQMSSGRYELTHVNDEAGSASRKDRGLGLGVIDHLVGTQPRDPKTLSGGETFYVSLALALALADVVATESGGTSMETLFIDEGFGTLDPETLDKVMAELAHLQAGGRTVGIVSHVEELRRQVPDRIEVRPGAKGSTLAVTAG